MSAFGTKRTFRSRSAMSAFGVKRTSAETASMSTNDPKRAWAGRCPRSLLWPPVCRLQSSVQNSSCGCVHHRSGQHARPVGSDEHCRVRKVLNSRSNFQKAGLRNPRYRLIFCDRQLTGQKLHSVLNGATVGVGQRSKADHPDTERANLERQIFSETFDRTKCCTDSG